MCLQFYSHRNSGSLSSVYGWRIRWGCPEAGKKGKSLNTWLHSCIIESLRQCCYRQQPDWVELMRNIGQKLRQNILPSGRGVDECSSFSIFLPSRKNTSCQEIWSEQKLSNTLCEREATAETKSELKPTSLSSNGRSGSHKEHWKIPYYSWLCSSIIFFFSQSAGFYSFKGGCLMQWRKRTCGLMRIPTEFKTEPWKEA